MEGNLKNYRRRFPTVVHTLYKTTLTGREDGNPLFFFAFGSEAKSEGGKGRPTAGGPKRGDDHQHIDRT